MFLSCFPCPCGTIKVLFLAYGTWAGEEYVLQCSLRSAYGLARWTIHLILLIYMMDLRMSRYEKEEDLMALFLYPYAFLCVFFGVK